MSLLLCLLGLGLAQEPVEPERVQPPQVEASAAQPAAKTALRVPGQLIAPGAGGGYDLASRQPFAGIDVAFANDRLKGFAYVGRLQAGWGFEEERPIGRVEAGFSGVVPARNLVRVGVVAGLTLFAATKGLPLQVPGPPKEGDWAALTLLPYGSALVELGGVRSERVKGWAAWAVGLRLGAGATLGARAGCTSPEFSACALVSPGFAGGLTARMRFHGGFFLDALAGPTSYISWGYAF